MTVRERERESKRVVLLTSSRAGHRDTPGLCNVLQQQRGYPAVSEGVPVDSVLGAMLQGEAELEVEVQYIHSIKVTQSPAVKVGFYHVVTQLGSLVLNLR